MPTKAQQNNSYEPLLSNLSYYVYHTCLKIKRTNGSCRAKVGQMQALVHERYTAEFSMVAVNSMVYLEPLLSRLDRLAQRQSSPFTVEAQQEYVK